MGRKFISLNLSITAFVTFFIVSLVGADTETFDETYEVSSGTRFEIHNRNGSVNIQSWDRSQIKVHATKKTKWGGKLKNVEIHVSQDADFKIETIHLVNRSSDDKNMLLKMLQDNINIFGFKKTELKKIAHTDVMKLTLPTLIIWGANDNLLSVAGAYRFRNNIPNAQLKVFDHCGHIPLIEYPNKFNTLVEDFLTK